MVQGVVWPPQEPAQPSGRAGSLKAAGSAGQWSRSQPSLRSELGPFVFGLYAFAVPSPRYAYHDYFTVRWSEYPRSTILDKYYLWYSLNGGRYQPVYGGNAIHLRRGNRVRFALRIINFRGQTSPVTYSPSYFT